jgi:hypothetical protein
MAMTRRAVLLAIVLIYVVAWFSPVAVGGTTLAKGGLPGWEAFRLALSPLWDPNASDSWWESVLSVLSAITNVWFVFVLATLWRSSAAPRRALAWGSLAAAMLNTHWLILYKPRSELRVGYYFWWISSVALAAAALRLSRQYPRDARSDVSS